MLSKSKKKELMRERRHRRIRAKISGTSEKPRLSVFRSNKYLYAQLVDDLSKKTIFSVSTKGLKFNKGENRAELLGKNFAQKAKEKKIKTAVFDRGGYMYAGVIRDFAEAVRKEGIKI